ncbi:(2Fe-2S)-binding protein [Kitasatospora sp. NPDC096147]|uniref:(2Fe-2S)-binding protein n=1 Tax=Kitasatospora sp. NPDC096147 TaxID=3364093 RepID=UPI00381115EC
MSGGQDLTDGQAVLRRVSAVGGFFAVTPGPRPPAGFRPVAELRGAVFLRERIADVARRMGTAEPRVAASAAQLGAAARLWSVGLGTAVLGGVVPDLAGAYWRLVPGSMLELWVPGVRGPGPAGLAAELYLELVEGQLRPFNEAVRRVTPVAEGLLWGNAASALAGAVKVLGGGRELAAELHAVGPLRGALRADGRRTSCCLYYRAPGAGLCGDCVFERPPRRR